MVVDSCSALESPAGAVAVSRPRSLPTATEAENFAMGQLIKTFRQRQRLTQYTFAQHVGILPSALSRIERGAQTVPASLFWRIALAFECPLDAVWNGATAPPTDLWTTLGLSLAKRLTTAQYAALSLTLNALLQTTP